MEFLNYITGKGGMMLIGLFVIFAFVFRKYKEKRYFKTVEKRINEREKNR